MTKSKRKPKAKKRASQWPRINAKVAAKVLKVVDAGLVNGMGDPKPGKMCVEAAVCYAMGEPHSDQPKCVLQGVRDLKICLNDHSDWGPACYDDKTDQVRAKGLRKLAIAQLGSKGAISEEHWNTALKEYYFRRCPKEKIAIKENEESRVRHLKACEETLLSTLKDVKAGNRFEIEVAYDPDDFAIQDQDWGEAIVDDINGLADLKKVCADMVKILTKLGSPGTKYLYLTK